MGRLALAGLLGLCLFPMNSQAAEDDMDLFALDLEHLLQVEVTGASWRQTPLRAAAASMTVFTTDDLQRLGVRYLHELLNLVPGMYSARSVTNGADYRVVLRGNASTTGGVLVVIDGQRVNTLQTTKPFGVLRHWPLALLERVEVIRGPGTARFGGGPSDAVINLVTRQEGQSARLTAGTDGQASADAQWGSSHGDWRLRLNAHSVSNEGQEYRGLFDRRGRRDHISDPDTGSTVIADLGWRGHDLQLFWHRSDQTGYYGLNGSLVDHGISEMSLEWLRYSGGAELGRWQWDWHASAVRQQFAVAAVQQAQGTGPFQQADQLLRGDLTHIGQSFGLSAQRRLDAHALTFGVDWQHGRTIQADLSSNYLLVSPFTYLGEYQPIGLRFIAADAEERFVAAYVEDDWSLSDKHRLVLGLRHDRYRHSGASTSPRASWVWTTGPDTTFKLLYQEAFFAAALGHLFLQNNPVLVGNPDLRPTTVRSLEAIYTRQLSRGLISATVYRRKADDLITQVSLGGAVDRPENAGRQDSTGMEWASQWALGEHWRLDFNASRVFSDHYELPPTLAEQPPASFLARDTASFSLNWSNPRWNALLGGYWRSREPLQAEHTPWTLMGNLRYRWSARLSAFFHVDNLLDSTGSDTEIAGGLGIDNQGRIVRLLPRPGRSAWLGFEYRWN